MVLEERVLGLAKKKGLISRSDAVSFCQISDDQAYRFLQKLVDKGKLKRVGKAGRFVQYGFKS
jgi:Fic family protein